MMPAHPNADRIAIFKTEVFMISAFHPALVHFPIALITFSVICELIGRFKQSPFARTAAWWTMVAALIGGALTVAAGYYDMWHAHLQEQTHALVHQHLTIGWALVVLVILLTAWRGWVRSHLERHVGWGSKDSAPDGAAENWTLAVPAPPPGRAI